MKKNVHTGLRYCICVEKVSDHGSVIRQSICGSFISNKFLSERKKTSEDASETTLSIGWLAPLKLPMQQQKAVIFQTPLTPLVRHIPTVTL